MRSSLLHRAAIGGLGALTALGLAAAVAQGVAQQRLDEALARIRALLGPDVTLEYASATPDPVADRITLTGVTLRDGPGTARIDRLVLSEIAARGGGVGRAEATNIAITGAEGAARVEQLVIAGLVLPPDGADFDPLAIRLDELRLLGASVQGPGGQGRLTSLEIGQVGGERPAQIDLRGLTFALQGLPVDEGRLDRFFMNGIRVDQIITAVTTLDPGLVPPGRSEMEIAGLLVRGGGQDLVALPRMAGWSDDAAGRPGVKTTQMWTEGFVLRASETLGTTFLRDLGYEQLALDFAFDGDVDQRAGLYDIRRMGVLGREVGRLNIAVSLEGLQAAGMALGMPPMDARLNSFAISYTDASFLGRAIRAEARDRGQSEQQIIERWSRDIRGGLRGGRAAAAGEQIVAFLRNPGTLTIAANPTMPIALAEIERSGRRGPAPLVDRLNITVTAARP